MNETASSSLLPTLQARDCMAGDRTRAEAGGKTASNGRRWGLNLRDVVLLPTLTASAYGSSVGGEMGREGQPERPSLQTMAKRGLLPTLTAREGSPNLRDLLPTLTARDGKSGATSPSQRPQARLGTDPLNDIIGGLLCPRWCEQFMGFPVGWTECDASAIASFRGRRRKRSSVSFQW